MSAQKSIANNEQYGFWSVSTLHLCALTFVALNALLAWQSGDTNFIIGSVYLLAYVHMGICIARNDFYGSRKTTWVLLVLAMLVSGTLGFSSYIIPSGPLSSSLSSAPVIGPYVAKFMQNMALVGLNLYDLGALIFLFILGINIAGYFKINSKGEGTLERIAALGILLIFALLLGNMLFSGQSTPVNLGTSMAASDNILPSWHLLPFYSALIAIPDKTVGIALLCIMLLIPVLAIFIGRPKAKGRRLFLQILMVLALASFIGLGVLGAHTVNSDTMIASLVLIAIYFSYFIIGTILTPRPEN